MKLMRNTPFGQKYTVLDNRRAFPAVRPLSGEFNEEYFVIMLKDRNAEAALTAYADEAEKTDPELAADVRELAERAGPNSPWCKTPD